THTDHQVAGFVRGASQIAILGFDKVDRPKDPPDAPPLVASAWVGAFDPATWQPIGKPAKLGPARELIVGYGTGDQLLVATATAPDDAHVAFATGVDPCAKDAAPSLYVADTKTSALKHLLTARSRFQTRWLDAQTLAYEDGDGAIRLWDAATGRESQRLDDR